ncbi:MAG: hypothetical protein IJV15_10240 [Lachnospiraceae bacterium]|nr:hypothetical protein [Lachnospiraceae bacterium]
MSELRDALDLGIARMLAEIRDYQVYNYAQYDFRYDIHYFSDDNNGVLPIGQMAEDISMMKADGWEIKHIFSNNSKAVTHGGGMQGVTVGDTKLLGVTYIIFEKRFMRP